ncbi:MAG: SPOR domain-containing protein [Porticoccus sp.]|nr:SPOR domain-containing protein [Porticoccus sp.]
MNDTPLLNQALSKTKTWLSNPGNEIYTIQVMSTHINDKKKLEAFLKRYSGQPLAASLFIHQAIKDDQTFYAVTYGGFNRYAAAKEQLETLPNALKRFDPYIKTITSLKNSIQ